MTIHEMTLAQLCDEYHCAMRSRTDRLAAAKAELERRQAAVDAMLSALMLVEPMARTLMDEHGGKGPATNWGTVNDCLCAVGSAIKQAKGK